jgi:ATP-dependent DNA helicase RecG
LIKRGENQTVEFKEKITNDIAETAAAFSTKDGGIILVGVDDKANILGIQDQKSEERIINILRSNCEPPIEPDFKTYTIDDKPILAVQIKEGKDKPYTIRGRGPMVRSGSTDRIATRDELDEIYREKYSTRHH